MSPRCNCGLAGLAVKTELLATLLKISIIYIVPPSRPGFLVFLFDDPSSGTTPKTVSKVKWIKWVNLRPETRNLKRNCQIVGHLKWATRGEEGGRCQREGHTDLSAGFSYFLCVFFFLPEKSNSKKRTKSWANTTCRQYKYKIINFNNSLTHAVDSLPTANTHWTNKT